MQRHQQGQQLPVVTSAASSSSPLRSTARRLDLPPRSHNLRGQELKKAINSASEISRCMTGAGAGSGTSPPPPASSTATTFGGSSSDPFSTPARRRRLVADVARFLLKQYCTQACASVHTARVRNGSAMVIQCLLRSFVARGRLRILLFRKQTAAATKIQSLCRVLAAREEMRRRVKEREKRVATHLALCVQCLCRVRRSCGVVGRVRTEKTAVAIGVQQMWRGKKGREIALKRKQERDGERAMQRRAAVTLQCRHRKRVAGRVLDQLRRVREREMCMASRLALHWRRYCRRRSSAAVVVQRWVRGVWGRVGARMRKCEKMSMRKECGLMELEDQRAGLLRAQHRVEIRVDLGASLLNSLKRCKASTLVKWCIEQRVLCYDEEESKRGSYSMGHVIRQVLRATSSGDDEDRDRDRHVELPPPKEREIELDVGDDRSLAIDQQRGIGRGKAEQLPGTDKGYPRGFGARYTYLPCGIEGDCLRTCGGGDDDRVSKRGRPLTLNISPAPGEGSGNDCVCMHLEPSFHSFISESQALRLKQASRGLGAPLDDPLACPDLSSCDVHIILGTTERSQGVEDKNELGGKYVGVGENNHEGEDEEEMLKFRFKDVSVSVSVTTIVSGDDTTECLVNTKKKREAEEAERRRVEAEEDRKRNEEEEKDRELKKLEETKALVAKINEAMAEQEACRVAAELEEAEEMRKEQTRRDTAAAERERRISLASAAGKKSRPSTATKRVKISVVDEELEREKEREKERERLRRLEEEREIERMKRLEADRLARLQKIRENAASRCVQRLYLSHCRHILEVQMNAACTLQGFARRWGLLRRWWTVVSQLQQRMTLAVVSVQKRHRGRRDRDLVIAKRLEACSSSPLQLADHWMNSQVLDDFRFALGRSFISEGKKGYVIVGSVEGRVESEGGSEIDGQNEEDDDEDEDDDDDDDEDDDGEDSSEDEDDYVINQRLNRNKPPARDRESNEAFIRLLFPPFSSYSTPVLCCSRETLTDFLSPAIELPTSLQGGGHWAAQLLQMLDFPPPPPGCVKPLEMLIHLPTVTAEAATDAVDVTSSQLGDLSAHPDPATLPLLSGGVVCPAERSPAVYSSGHGHSTH